MTLASMVTSLLLLHLFAVISFVNGITCGNCIDVELPGHCRDTANCGEGEICFTQEYKDHRGRQAFRLGCMSQEMCTIYINAKTLFGKRNIPDPAPPERCYQCCSSEECNVALCYGTGGLQSLTTPSSHAPEPNCHTQNVCPEMFVPFQDFCYVFLPDTIGSWLSARHVCKSLGSDLVSVTSQEENDFLARGLTLIKASQVAEFWTGGIFSSVVGEFEWVDRSPFNYTNWYGLNTSPYPTTTMTTPYFSRNTDQFIKLKNPAYSNSYLTAPFHVTTSSSSSGVICKTHNY